MGIYERQNITFKEIQELFLQGIDCSQVVAGAFAGELETDKVLLRKVSACFGGGMQCGETCGAVTGALMVLGMKYGHSEEGDPGQKQVMMQKTGEFKRLFGERYPSCICRDLLGHDISRKEELAKVMEKGLLLQFCPKVVEDTIEILGKIL
jgi:C_GCAxxG_C_C family probable redox protein|nr:C-GCAxxG-C-C family protein [Lacrimispora celerecrescens]